MSMEVAYLVSLYPAPSHTFIRREIDALRKQGIPIQTFSVRRPAPDELASELDRNAFADTFYILPASPGRLFSTHLTSFASRPVKYVRALLVSLRHRVPGIRSLFWALFHFAEAILLARELERRGIRHLHNHFANAGATVGLIASDFLDLPWSLTLHGISETDYPAGLLLGDKISAAQFVACVSYFGEAQAMRLAAPKDWDKFFISRCALDLPKLPPRVRRSPAARLRLICVGRLSAEKGHLGLLQAFAIARAKGADAELVLVGDGPEKIAIQCKIDELGLGASVQLTGMLPEEQTLAEIASSDVLVMASFMEGLPVVLMEAMALGLTVIAPRVAGIPELVIDGRNGLLFAPSNWQELAETILVALRDPELREQLGRAGNRSIEHSFDISVAIAPLKERFALSLKRHH
jgi:glycosyltransferase involved in cell wall biosynthesis